ncbi:MAG: hypothetical protein AAFY75_00225 [Pseudomonadota bacterium]
MAIQIQIDDDTALALFDFLSRTLDEQNGDTLQDATVHDGELWALNTLQGVLERALTQPFKKSYRERVKAALEVLTLKSGAWPSAIDKY